MLHISDGFLLFAVHRRALDPLFRRQRGHYRCTAAFETGNSILANCSSSSLHKPQQNRISTISILSRSSQIPVIATPQRDTETHRRSPILSSNALSISSISLRENCDPGIAFGVYAVLACSRRDCLTCSACHQSQSQRLKGEWRRG